jgi:hypothetical protein
VTRAEAIAWFLGDVDQADELLELLAQERAETLSRASHLFAPAATYPGETVIRRIEDLRPANERDAPTTRLPYLSDVEWAALPAPVQRYIGG